MAAASWISAVGCRSCSSRESRSFLRWADETGIPANRRIEKGREGREGGVSKSFEGDKSQGRREEKRRTSHRRALHQAAGGRPHYLSALATVEPRLLDFKDVTRNRRDLSLRELVTCTAELKDHLPKAMARPVPNLSKRSGGDVKSGVNSETVFPEEIREKSRGIMTCEWIAKNCEDM